ncbi:hypothetical protein FBY30_2767 [Arthrobacter sp. SLBN-83]|nr:hypothetical protein [Arthrobacter sp. SLBN-83]TQJ60499.1 hypothetical protein FBY30_2767 [Arthrobacter sp. SLBN-83]
MTAAQFEDQEGRDLVQAIHRRKFDYNEPLPPAPKYRGREWEPTTDKEQS